MTTKTKSKLDVVKSNGSSTRKSPAGAAKVVPTKVAQEEAQHPIDHIEKITELEVMTFRALDAEIRNLELSGRSLALEMQNAQNEMEKTIAAFKRQQDARQAAIDQAQHGVAELKPRYIQVVTEIATKYHLDPSYMAIDPEARTVRDLRGEATT
jgi:hypothetical protein